MNTPRRFRFAPTPSRPLHLGNGLAALLGWGLARAAGARFVLRIEDIDRARCRPEFEASCLADLRWLGLDWDEGPDVGGAFGPYRQSERLDRYDALRDALVARGDAYPCACSRADVRAASSAPHAGASGEVPYPGTCRPDPAGAASAAAARGAPLAVDRGGHRLDVTALGDDARVTWVDGLLGVQREDVRASCGDFLLGRPGEPTYQLAVVADDRAMGVTDVVRGRDLIDSTARQLLLHAALARVDGLAAPTPRFTHHPLLLDGGGRKLSKRDGDLALAAWREGGAAPASLRAALGRAVGLFSTSVTAASADDVVASLRAAPPLRDGDVASVVAPAREASG